MIKWGSTVFVLFTVLLSGVRVDAKVSHGGSGKGLKASGSQQDKPSAQERQKADWGASFLKLKNATEDSCDHIFLQDGKEILARVTKMTDTLIEYRECGSAEEKIFTVSRSEVLLMKLANGTTMVMGDGTAQPSEPEPVVYEFQKNEPCSTLSLVFSLGTVLGVIIFPFLILLPITGIVLGAVGLQRHRDYPGRYRNNRWMAKFGLILSVVLLVLALLGLLLILAFFFL